MRGIIAHGVYLPYHRLERRAIRDALGHGGGAGTRSVASYDEDSTSMGVEAGRRALNSLPPGSPSPTALFFATSDPAYLEKSNASALHAALGLDRSVAAYDLGGALRSGIGALRTALERAGTTLVIASDVRGGLPGGMDESASGDAAVAFLTADSAEGGLAQFIGVGAVTTEVLERWRLPGELAGKSWEERFGESVLIEPARSALQDALKDADVADGGVGVAAISGTSARAVAKVAAGLVRAGSRVTEGIERSLGCTGTAHAGLLLVAALENAAADEVVAAIGIADGADVLLFRATGSASREGTESLLGRIAWGGKALSYPTFLTWRGHLRREPPRRPDNERPDAPAALRAAAWKYGFMGSRCLVCGRRHLPPQQVCIECGSVDQMQPERVADTPGRVVTYTIDRVSYSVHPPVIAAVIEFDGGGRFQCELTDVDADEVEVGLRVRMTFRRMYTAQGVHNYFWKATPIRAD
jgi:3-hydroxy-3-methylglutaryl CoA synthase/uncharacterized OB-fold protein